MEYTIRKFFKNGQIQTNKIWTRSKGVVNRWKKEAEINSSIWAVNIITR